MNRREILAWISRGLAAGVTTVIGLPGIQYLLGGTRSNGSGGSEFARLIRFKDLLPGRPMMVPVIGQKQDAWVRHDRQVVGRVWLVRKPGDAADPSAEGLVKVMSTICPHMGCQVNSQAGGKGFHCPCHGANFGLDGERQTDPRSGERNHAPRDLDPLDCRVVQDESSKEWWVEVKYEKFATGREDRVATA